MQEYESIYKAHNAVANFPPQQRASNARRKRADNSDDEDEQRYVVCGSVSSAVTHYILGRKETGNDLWYTKKTIMRWNYDLYSCFPHTTASLFGFSAAAYFSYSHSQIIPRAQMQIHYIPLMLY